MNPSNAEEGRVVSGLEQGVADYLRGHPDFFTRHPEVLAELELLHACGRAVSLIEYQVVVLREQGQRLRRRLHDLVETARENEQLSERVHRLVLDLVTREDLPSILLALYRALGESFGAERATVRLFRGPAAERDAALAEFLGADQAARRLLAPALGAAAPICGRIPADQLAVLFGDAGAEVRSGALLPLGVDDRIGVLALGSRDESRYRPGMATTFLRQLAEVASQVMRPHLAAPAETATA
jgi:hypothetical protein